MASLKAAVEGWIRNNPLLSVVVSAGVAGAVGALVVDKKLKGNLVLCVHDACGC